MRSFLNTVALGAIAALGLVATGAQAQTTFAQFSAGSLNNFQYVNAANTFGNVGASIPVSFQYTAATLYGPAFTPIAATMTFSSNGAATVNAGNELPLTGITMTITANTAGPLGSNLLSATSSTGVLGGTLNSNTPPLTADTAVGNTVVFTSNYLSFTSTTARVISLTTANSTPTYTLAANSRPNSFSGTYVGSFASNPAPVRVEVPEANAGLLAGLALPLLGGIAVLRRRK